MSFSLPLFIFYLFPVFLIIYLVLPQKFKNSFLLIFSILFYAFSAKTFTIVLIISIAINYTIGLLLKNKWKNLFFIAGILLNLAILGVFKYYNFFIENFNSILNIFNTSSISSTLNIFLPIGLSFYTLQNIAYLIDIKHEEIQAEKNLIRFGTFTAMFPKVVVGPIERYSNLKSNLIKKESSLEDFSIGARRFIIGLFKKVVIADGLETLINSIFNLNSEHLSTHVAWLGIISFGIQLYFDFSGYSDMAIGIGKMCGFTFIENFNYPYISKSIQEFWQRWHISLSTWLSDYIFKPLQLNLRYYKVIGSILSILITFTISGLWHGASWNFVIWGLYHGIFLSLEFLFFAKVLKRFKTFANIYMLLVVFVGWTFFRTTDISHSFVYLNKLFYPSFFSSEFKPIMSLITYEHIIFVILGIIFSTPLAKTIKRFLINSIDSSHTNKLNLVYFLSFLILFVISLAYVAIHSYKPFLYGGF